MLNGELANRLGPDRSLAEWAKWTDRIAAGETPKAKPKRPQGVERNIVVTWWEWSDPKKYLHDLIASDRRYPTVNAYGPLFGSPEYSTDLMPMTPALREKVLAGTDAGQLRRAAWQDGLKPLRIRGAHKVAEGVTTIAEVLRVAPPGED
jgi:hypothetical protein